MRLLLIALLWAMTWHSAAQETRYEFETPEQRALFKELSAELRCPKCQNQNIADSNAMVSQDMKRKTYELVKGGSDRDEVLDFMKQRYGDFVHYQPPLNPLTVLLWLLPAAFIIFAATVIIRRRKSQQIDPDAIKRAEAMLEKDYD